MTTPLDALDTYLETIWIEYGETATNGIEITLPHTLALATFAEFPHLIKQPKSLTWISPYGKIRIIDADHA